MHLMRKLLLGMLWLVGMYFAGITLPGCAPMTPTEADNEDKRIEDENTKTEVGTGVGTEVGTGTGTGTGVSGGGGGGGGVVGSCWGNQDLNGVAATLNR